MILSKKAEGISPSITLEITAKIKKMKDEGIDIIGFGAGEPDFNTPENIQLKAIEAIKNGNTKYTASAGINELKEAIVKKFKNENNLNYKVSQVIVSTGAKQSLSNAFAAILNPGDEVIVPVPYWVSYPELIKLSDGVPVFVNTRQEDGFMYTLEELNKAKTTKTKAIIVNSPNNPTGTIYNRTNLQMIADFAKENDLIIISDEIYEKLIYDGNKHVSIAALSEDTFNRTIVINGVSKTYSMTGWRIGYAAASESIVKLMTNIQSHTTSNPTSIAQYASLEALEGIQSTVEAMVNEFKNRRNYMVEKINSIKLLSCYKPEGAFYVMININELIGKEIQGVKIKNSMDFSMMLLDIEKVAVIPGAGFGVDNYVRLSYATSMKNIVEGLNRIENFINKNINL